MKTSVSLIQKHILFFNINLIYSYSKISIELLYGTQFSLARIAQNEVWCRVLPPGVCLLLTFCSVIDDSLSSMFVALLWKIPRAGAWSLELFELFEITLSITPGGVILLNWHEKGSYNITLMLFYVSIMELSIPWR